MSAHVLLNLLNELGKRDKMRGLPSILSLFRNELCALDPNVKVKGQIIYFLLNAYSPKLLDVAIANFEGA